jgi:hypothetical protein
MAVHGTSWPQPFRLIAAKNIPGTADRSNELTAASAPQQLAKRPHIDIDAPPDDALIAPQACEKFVSREYATRILQKIFKKTELRRR